MKLGRITLVLLLLFVLNVIISACGKDSNKRAVKVSNGKSGASALVDPDKADSADATTADSKSDNNGNKQQDQDSQSEQTCGLKLNDDMSASDPCLKERESKQIIDNKKFEAKQIIVKTLEDRGNENVSTYEIRIILLDKEIQGEDKCAMAPNGTGVVMLRLAVDLSSDGSVTSIKKIEPISDHTDLGLILVPEESHVDLQKVVHERAKSEKDYMAQEVIRKIHFGLKDLNFTVNGKTLFINQEKIDLELDLFNEEEGIDFTLKSSAIVCGEQSK